MMKRLILLLGAVLLLSGCGLIYGQMMGAGDGVKSFRVVEGRLGALQPGGTLLVYGPFAKTDAAFYICRGEDAAKLSEALGKAGPFHSELYLERDYDHLERTARALRDESPQHLQASLGLDAPPQWLLFGTILQRSTSVAPGRGVEMAVAYRLEFFNIASRESTVVEVGVQELAQKTVPLVAEELARRIAGEH